MTSHQFSSLCGCFGAGIAPREATRYWFWVNPWRDGDAYGVEIVDYHR
jgi:hypothetical protein